MRPGKFANTAHLFSRHGVCWHPDDNWNNALLSIGELAKATDIKVATICYYEKMAHYLLLAFIASHQIQIEQKIADQNQLEIELRSIHSQCKGGGTIADCRIIDALAGP